MQTPLIRIIIIDDEPVICQSLVKLIEGQPGFLAVATGGSVAEGLTLIPALQPDLLLLDISLGQETGFDILERLSPLSFRVIFITGYDQYAIRAIKFGALDYILKPVDELELSAALCKAATARPVDSQQWAYSQQQLLSRSEPGRIMLRSNHLLHVVLVEDIIYLHSEAGITTFHLSDGQRIAVHKTIREYEDLLPPAAFIRAHQSYLVNKHFVKSYHHAGRLNLSNGEALPVATRRKDYVIAVLSNNL